MWETVNLLITAVIKNGEWWNWNTQDWVLYTKALHWRWCQVTHRQETVLMSQAQSKASPNHQCISRITDWQKGHFGAVSECPCCGWHKETQLHMFHCMSPEMKWRRKSTFQLLKRYYRQHKIPTVVYIPFLEICKATCELEELKWHNSLSPSVRNAVKGQ